MILHDKENTARGGMSEASFNDGLHVEFSYKGKRLLAVLIAVSLLIAFPTFSAGQFQTPSYIRVGLYYKDSSTNTALPVFNVSAAAGIQAGYFINGSFSEIYREQSSSTLFVRKDSYFYNTGDTLKEYNPEATSRGAIADLPKYGPFHIKIGGNFPDQASAAAQVAAYRQAGVQAYIAFNDSWQVWIGTYTDEAAALKDIEAIAPLAGGAEMSVILPAANRIVLTDAQYQPLCIFGSNTAYFQLRPTPENNPPVITIKNRQYRGALEVRRLAASDMTVINYLSMRDYLYGNVPAEIGANAPAEAIKAQAVASKMYAINNMGKHSKTGFDLAPTTSDQVYRGYAVESPKCNAAIDQVINYVITYNGKLAEAIYYFASGGGRTEDVRNVWGSSYPYLVSVEDNYEKIYTWTKTLRASDIKTKLPQLGNILGVSVTQRSESGRVTQLSVRGDGRPDPAIFTLEKTRTLFSLDSQLYTITTDADVYAATLKDIPAPVALVPAGVDLAGGTVLQGSATLPVTASLYAESTVPLLEASALTLGSVPTTASGITEAALSVTASQSLASGQSLSTNSNNVQTIVEPDVPTGNQSNATGGASADTRSSLPADASGTTPSAIVTQAAMKINIPMPVATNPSKMQLGGIKAVSAGGETTVKSSSNKVTVLGAEGAIRTATLVPETYTFTGKGWGHAVGMSQEGAIGMGRAGFAFDQILGHYFPGTKVEQN